MLEGEELLIANNALAQYSLYIQARKLGIKLAPSDLDVDTLQVLYDLQASFEAIQQRKVKKRGKKRP